jgi:hypothetical protein
MAPRPPAAKPERRPGALERFDSEWKATTRSGSAEAAATAASAPGGGAWRQISE